MKTTQIFPILFAFFLLISCAGEGDNKNFKKLGDGVYQYEGWIYDMKEYSSGKDVIPSIQ